MFADYIIEDENNYDEDIINNIYIEENLILGGDQLKYLPTGRGGLYLVVQLPAIVTTTGIGLHRMYRLIRK